MNFDEEKKVQLGKEDKSIRGMVDSGIKELVDEINRNKNYYTTSSCAGRTVLIEKEGYRKDKSEWLYIDHDEANHDKIKAVLFSKGKNKLKNYVWIKQESAILHICCKSLEDADELCKMSKSVGFKRAGIVNITPRIIVELFGNEKVEVRVAKDGKVLLNEDFLICIVEECNEKMLRNKERIARMLEAFRKME